MNIQRIQFLLFVLLVLVLTACEEAGGPALLAILSPASGAEVAGTVAVQVSVAESEGEVAVRVYARGAGSSAEGRLVGSAVAKQAVIQWDTSTYPSATGLELYATAQGGDSQTYTSDPVQVKVQNAGAPSLSYLVGFTIPPKPVGTSAALESSVPAHTPFVGALPPQGVDLSQKQPTLQPLASARDLVAEWAWTPVVGAAGYSIKLSSKSLAGDFDEVGRPAATTSTSGLQKYSKLLTANPGDAVFGAITSMTGAGSEESDLSNADVAVFLPAQTALSPKNDEVVDSFSEFDWDITAGADGYLYYVYDKNPWASDAKLKCTNYPYSTDQHAVSISDKCADLLPGTYYWWVAGVSFNNLGKVDAFSYSDPATFVVP